MRTLWTAATLLALSGPFAAARTQLPRSQFERALRLATTAETSANASIGGVNGDGKPDIVLAKGRH